MVVNGQLIILSSKLLLPRINIGDVTISRHVRNRNNSGIITDQYQKVKLLPYTTGMSIRPKDPSGIAEPDFGPANDEPGVRDKGKGKGRAVEEKPHSPFIGFAAGLCSG
jgi:hypothetical protein